MTTTYVATPADISKLARELFAAADQAVQGRTTYLRLLLGTVQHELGAKTPRTEARGRQHVLTAEEITHQLTALNAVHERFYDAVLKEAARGDLPAAAKERALVLNRRTNFARSSVSTLRSYIRAGNDITRVVVAKATKKALMIARVPRPLSPKRLRKRVEARSKALMSAVLALAEAERDEALQELQILIDQLTQEAKELAGKRAPARSVRVPVTESQVLRHMARPS